MIVLYTDNNYCWVVSRREWESERRIKRTNKTTSVKLTNPKNVLNLFLVIIIIIISHSFDNDVKWELWMKAILILILQCTHSDSINFHHRIKRLKYQSNMQYIVGVLCESFWNNKNNELMVFSWCWWDERKWGRMFVIKVKILQCWLYFIFFFIFDENHQHYIFTNKRSSKLIPNWRR